MSSSSTSTPSPGGLLHAWLQNLGLAQANRPLRLRIGGADAPLAHTLMVHRFHASEATCAATSLSLRLLCVTTRADIPPWQFLGQPLQLQVVTDSGRLRAFNALIVRAQPGQFDGSLQTWLIEAVDACTFMGAGRNSRIYLRKNVIEITEQLLGEWRAHSPVLAGCFDFDTRQLTPDRYPQREMSIQWNESDPAFLMRLWRKHGIAWGVRAEAETSPTDPPRHTLVLVDDSAQLPANPAGRLRCHTGTAVREHDDITLWSPVGRVVPSLVERAAWSYTQQQPLRADTRSMAHLDEQGDALARALTDVRIEPPHWADGTTHHQQLTLLRMQHHEMNATAVSGASTARDLACLTWAAIDEIPGELPLAGPSEAAGNEFLFTQVSHWGSNNLPKDIADALDSLIAASGWELTRPNIGQHDEARRYANTFCAIPRHTPLSPAFDPALHWPSLPPMSAVVVCPEGEEVYCDEHGRVHVQFQGLRATDHSHAAGAGTSGTPGDSAPVRVATPAASARQGFIQLPRRGDEVIVSFMGGDPDKPIITHAVHSPANPPPRFHDSGNLPGNRHLSGNRSIEIKGSRATHVLHDSTPGQPRFQAHCDFTHSQLNLGYIVHPRQDGKAEPRGEGLELRTDGAAATRAARGILLSAWKRLGSSGGQLDYAEALALMESGLELFKSMGDYAARHQGRPPEADGQAALHTLAKQWENGTNTAPKAEPADTAFIALTAPQGIVHTTPETIAQYAGHNADTVAQHHVQIAAGQHYAVNAGQGIRQFAHGGGIHHIAHQGEFVMQSQHDNTRLESALNINLNAGQETRITARSITLVAEDGSFIKIGDGITLGTNGAIKQHAASFPHAGPQTVAAQKPEFTQEAVQASFVLRRNASNPHSPPLAEQPYKIELSDGSVVEGITDAEGRTSLAERDAMHIATISAGSKA
ncbi:hypothetical protein ZRA01_22270 [Zoogloea ramigera]|uniref:Type VI secretion system secreted protein VgrG n=1 Tax=Zoogloea ramigera TaxID=350 RepID=A0A4Y4CXF4_ZOORA|nr:type VI secretion system tip protein TssI/VgrG [Zoogloea ramigera]GEC96154.1 hypothetical protein ZRA01_22270 [Zoogloea ramigera]